MAVTVTTTAGASTANSYISVANAATYLETHPDYDTWDALGDGEKARYLILATRIIDQQPLVGDKYDTGLTSGVPNQRLHFPTSADISGGTKYIPTAVQYATCAQALFLAQRGGAGVSARQKLQMEGVTSATFADVSETYGAHGSDPEALAPEAKNLLLTAGLLELSGGLA